MVIVRHAHQLGGPCRDTHVAGKGVREPAQGHRTAQTRVRVHEDQSGRSTHSELQRSHDRLGALQERQA